MKAYIVQVETNRDCKVSQDGYRTLQEAQTFIKHRGDNPKKLTEWKYQGWNYTYKILEINIRP